MWTARWKVHLSASRFSVITKVGKQILQSFSHFHVILLKMLFIICDSLAFGIRFTLTRSPFHNIELNTWTAPRQTAKVEKEPSQQPGQVGRTKRRREINMPWHCCNSVPTTDIHWKNSEGVFFLSSIGLCDKNREIVLRILPFLTPESWTARLDVIFLTDGEGGFPKLR